MPMKIINRLFAAIGFLLFGFSIGAVVEPVRDVRAPLETQVATAEPPLASAIAQLTALAPPPGQLTLATVMVEHATVAVQATEAEATVSSLRATIAMRETEVSGVAATPRPTRIPSATVTAPPTSTPPATPTSSPTMSSVPATPTPSTPGGKPTATEASVAGSGATNVPTVSSGKVEVVAWGGPYEKWVPIIIVNGTNRPVMVDRVVLRVGGKNVGSGGFFAPALLQPGQQSIGTLSVSISTLAGVSATSFVITTSTPTAADNLPYEWSEEPELSSNGSVLVASIRIAPNAGETPYAVVKGVCFDGRGDISGFFWETAVSLIDKPGSVVTVRTSLIGPGPCRDPLIGIAT